MNYQQMTEQPLLNLSALIRAVGMWAILWVGAVLFLVYQNQPGVICMTPMAWLLALPAGWNYVAFSEGRPGRQPFVAGALVGALLGLIFGLLAWGVGLYAMPAGPEEGGKLTMQQIALIFIGGGVLIGGLISGMMAQRAAVQQRRGRSVPVINVK